MANSIEEFRIKTGEYPYLVEGLAILCGDDLILVVGGGSSFHTGAVAVACCHPSHQDPQKASSTASVIALMGHKEDELARNAALKCSRQLSRTVTVSLGMHLDEATPHDIDSLVQNFNTLVEQVIDRLKQTPLSRQVQPSS